MSIRHGCEVVVADFAWWSQTCGEPSAATVEQDGVLRHVCLDHFAAVIA